MLRRFTQLGAFGEKALASEDCCSGWGWIRMKPGVSGPSYSCNCWLLFYRALFLPLLSPLLCVSIGILAARWLLSPDRESKMICWFEVSALPPSSAKLELSWGTQDSLSGLACWLSSLQATCVTRIFYMSVSCWWRSKGVTSVVVSAVFRWRLRP